MQTSELKQTVKAYVWIGEWFEMLIAAFHRGWRQQANRESVGRINAANPDGSAPGLYFAANA